MTTLGSHIDDDELQAAIFDVDGLNVSPANLSGANLGGTVRLVHPLNLQAHSSFLSPLAIDRFTAGTLIDTMPAFYPSWCYFTVVLNLFQFFLNSFVTFSGLVLGKNMV
jgi:hypothetical protein